MSYRTLVNKFTMGELDPKFLGEVDYEGYRKGARKARNVVCTPQGSAQRRFGSSTDRVIPNVLRNRVALIGYEYLSFEKYWLILRDNLGDAVVIDIYLDNTLMQEGVVLTGITPDMIPLLRYVPAINKIIFLHEGHIPIFLQRLETNNWVVANAVLSLYPVEDFSQMDSPAANYTNNGTTFTPNNVDATTITASTAVFTSNHAGIPPNGGGLFVGNGGIFRIVSINAGGTVATGYTTDEFADTSAIKGAESYLAERIWGDGSVIGDAPAGLPRGFPRHGDFFQSRLVLGGSPSSPGAACASEVKDYLSFDNSNNDPSSGWIVEAGGNGSDLIEDVISTKSLVLLTNKGSSATSILVDTATTPGNVFLNAQGKETSRNMDGVFLNNQILYADYSGNTIWSMIYDVPDSGYTVTNASILSSQLIRNPIWADVFDPATVDGRYYLLLNSDGTMAILNSILEQNIHAWTLAETTGSYLDVACIGDQAKVLVERQVGTGAVTQGYAQAYWTADSTFNIFHKIETDAEQAASIVVAQPDDYLLIGNSIKFTKLFFSFVTPALEDMDLTFEFLADTGTWEEFNPTDLTDGFQENNYISWDPIDVTNWAPRPIPEIVRLTQPEDPVSYYWMRIKRNNDDTDVSGPYLDIVYANVKNQIQMETLSFDVYMDAQITTNADGTPLMSDELGIVEGLESLAGQDAFFFCNDFPIGNFYIESDGVADIGELYKNSVIRVGLDYKPLLVPMPLVALLQNGYMVYEPQKLKSLYIDYYLSLGITVNNQRIPQIVPGEYMTDQKPMPESGVYYVPVYNGWDPREPLIISQSYPGPMVIRGISYEVEIN